MSSSSPDKCFIARTTNPNYNLRITNCDPCYIPRTDPPNLKKNIPNPFSSRESTSSYNFGIQNISRSYTDMSDVRHYDQTTHYAKNILGVGSGCERGVPISGTNKNRDPVYFS